MSKEVDVQQLAERIDEIVAAVQAGETVTLLKDGQSIASVTPTRRHRGVKYPFRNFDFGARPMNLSVDVADVIRDDRDAELKKYGL